MRLDQIDLNLFIVFDVIYREANLTKAAEVLCITQPAVSNALARLRKTFDDPLFERTSDGMKPTPLAQRLIPSVREALWALNNGIAETENFNPHTVRQLLRISLNDLASALILPSLVPLLREQAPGIVLETQAVNQNEMINELSAARLSFSIDTATVIDPLLYHAPLLRDEFVCAVRKNHPVVDQHFSIERYLSLDHIHTSSRADEITQVDLALNREGAKRKIKARLQNYLVAPQLLANTDLAVTIPRSLAKTFDLAILELPLPVAPMELHMYWHKSRQADPGHQWLRKTILTATASTQG